LPDLQRAIDQAPGPVQRKNLIDEQRIAEAAYIHFKSAANQSRFIMARNALQSASSDGAQRARLIAEMKAMVRDEIELARRLFALTRADSRIGYEASNNYYYYPLDLVEKVINGHDLLTALEGLSDKPAACRPAEPPGEIVFENDYLKYVLGTDGRNLHFIDKRSGKDYGMPSPADLWRASKSVARK